MSNRANRSFENITPDDLKHLSQLALNNFEDFFRRNPKHPYVGRMRLICLLQTAAKHYVEPDQGNSKSRKGGVNDFDVCGIFEAIPNRHLFARRKCQLDFGPSKFGRNPDDDNDSKGAVSMLFGVPSSSNRWSRQSTHCNDICKRHCYVHRPDCGEQNPSSFSGLQRCWVK
jgi:hypothetical protein